MIPNHDYTTIWRDRYSYCRYAQNADGSYSWTPWVGAVYLGTGTAKYGDYALTHSISTPGFRRLKRRYRPINSYDKTTNKFVDDAFEWEVIQEPPGQQKTWYKFTTTAYYQGRLCNRGPSADDPTQKAVSRLNQQVTLEKTNTAVAMAEANKTAAHLAHAVKRIYSAITALKTGNLSGLTDALGMAAPTRKTNNAFNKRYATALNESSKVVGRPRESRTEKFWRQQASSSPSAGRERRFDSFLADTWLEYSYGWKPLIKDIYSHAEAFATVLVDTQFVVRKVSASAKSERVTPVVTVLNNDKTWNFSKSSSDKLWVKFGINYSIPSSRFTEPTNVFGLQNPLTVAWELVPFSFVVDWFLPVGSALEAMTATNGLEFHSGWKTSRNYHYVWESFVGTGNRVLVGTSWNRCSGHGENWKEWFSQTRVRIFSWPSYGMPQWKDPRSIAHAASAIALLQSLFLRK